MTKAIGKSNTKRRETVIFMEKKVGSCQGFVLNEIPMGKSECREYRFSLAELLGSSIFRRTVRSVPVGAYN